MIKIITDAAEARALRNRDIESYGNYADTVRAILSDVAARGDEALLESGRRFDCPTLESLTVTEEEIDEAIASLPPEVLETIKTCADNIAHYHRRQVREGFTERKENGCVIGQRILPLERVGVYVPGGTASYPSTVLMNVIPAAIAGVPEIFVTTPAGRDGKVAAPILAAARIAGATRVFKCGGASAIAALAYGTETIPAVEKITGPGNIYVALAKREVFGRVGIDMIAGPSEILVIADETADAEYVAADLLSQAEHDRLAASILICTSLAFAEEVAAAVERQIALLPRADIARESIETNGRIAVVSSLAEAAELSNDIAPEHLELAVADPFALLPLIKSAGSVFLGSFTPESLGDYYAGPNHTLPTSGSARFASPLSVDDFIKKSSFIYYTQDAISSASVDIARFARLEGLEAHARAAEIRRKK